MPRRPVILLAAAACVSLAATARAADPPTPLRDQLLPDLDESRRLVILGDAVRDLGPERLRQVAEAIRVRDELTFHGVHDATVIAAYVDAALSSDPAVRNLASRGAAWGGLRTAEGAIDAPTDAQLAAWSRVRLEVAPVVWAVATSEAGARWVALTSPSADGLTVDPQVAGFEGPNFGGPGLPLLGWTVSRGGGGVAGEGAPLPSNGTGRLTEARAVYPLLALPAESCPEQHVAIAYAVTGTRKATLVAAAALSPGGGGGGPAMVVACGVHGVPDRPSVSGTGAHLRWPCAADALDPAAYLPVEVTLPARADACLDRAGVDTLVAAANVAALRPLGMERFRPPPLALPEVVLPTVTDPSLDPGLFADPD